MSSAVSVHATNKMCHVLKFVSFLRKNNDIPYIVKRRVFDAALTSSLLYGCESWVGADIKPVVKLYNWALKQLLGVRRTTSNQVCYAEAGCPPLADLVKYEQHKFFRNKWSEREYLVDDPLIFAINLIKSYNNPISRHIIYFTGNEVTPLSVAMDSLRASISQSASSRCVVYKEINPTCSVHSLYVNKHNINEAHRIAFTRFRVSGHSLAIETGRWNRRGRGRLPLEERLCVCGEIQTERHVVQYCPVTLPIRNSFHFSSMEELFSDIFPMQQLAR